ncbi:MAG TPA: glucose-6-phosphate dehydrogenase, partial [Candidatus Limnocylindrales bacterium]
MTDTAVPKRRKTSAEPEAPAVGPDSAPDKTPHASPRAKDAPRTMKDLRIARQGKRKPPPKQDDNPLREGLRLERVPDPSTLVLFGATGDLAHRKVVPALYQLWRTNLLPHEFVILAIGRREYDDETLRAEFRASAEKYSRVLPLDEAAWRSFASRIRYQRCDFADPAGYDKLAKTLETIDREQRSSGNHLYYLATQPSAFAEIVAQLGRVGLDHERHEGGWRRIIIEKPFGHDLQSAIRLNREVGKVFRESQVYRIDHYLGKETVRNLLVFRFGNGIFEPIWNRRHIDHVQITVAETIGVENRGAFYEETGASRDILQNHLLQLMSLVAMEPPATFDADALRDEKVKVIRAIGELTPDQIQNDVVRGQYGPGWVAAQPVKGYREELEVDPESETETFVAARFEV